MIHHESWYKEAIHEDYLRERHLLERDPTPDRKKLVDDAIRSWRMGRTSELEKRALDDHTLLDLLFMTARRSGYLPYLTMPDVFFTSKGLPEEFRADVFELAFFMAPRDTQVRKWFTVLVSKGMDFEEGESEYLVKLAITFKDQEPELLTSIIRQGRISRDTPLDHISRSLQEEVEKSAIYLAEKHKDPDILRWLWGELEDFPDISWEAVFATPEDALPDVGYTVTYFDLAPGDQEWMDGDGDSGYVNLKEFAKLYYIWDGFDWDNDRGSDWFLTTGEHWETVDPKELDPEDAARLEESQEELQRASQVNIYFDDRRGSRNERGPSTNRYLVTWLREHWPPPNTIQETKR